MLPGSENAARNVAVANLSNSIKHAASRFSMPEALKAERGVGKSHCRTRRPVINSNQRPSNYDIREGSRRGGPIRDGGAVSGVDSVLSLAPIT